MPIRAWRTPLPVAADEAWSWHARPGAFARLVAPWHRVRMLDRGEGISEGSRAVLEVRTGPLAWRWVAVHRDVVPGAEFTDVQESGPFRRWVHRHRFEPAPGGTCVLEDTVDYAPALAGRGLDRLFRFRHARTAHDLSRHGRAAAGPLRIGMTGATGLVGRHLEPFLTAGGHDVVRLVRGRPRPGSTDVPWDPRGDALDPEALDGLDAIVHLAGENIAGGRWTEPRKREIRESRVAGTSLLARAMARAPRVPRVLVTASAIGYYGTSGTEPVDEQAPPGEGFLAEVVAAWEDAARPAEDAGVRVVRLRTGIVLSAEGGVLGRMLLPFRLGAGGPVGRGTQGFSWIALDDLLGAYLAALTVPALSGAVNAVAPSPVSQRAFARALGRVLRRPALAPLPASVVGAVFGEMGRELLLGSQWVRPAALEGVGFRWSRPHLEDALRFELGRDG